MRPGLPTLDGSPAEAGPRPACSPRAGGVQPLGEGPGTGTEWQIPDAQSMQHTGRPQTGGRTLDLARQLCEAGRRQLSAGEERGP